MHMGRLTNSATGWEDGYFDTWGAYETFLAGESGDGRTNTLGPNYASVDPDDVPPNYPTEAQVLNGVAFGTTGAEEFTGNYVEVTIANVRSTIAYGSNSEKIGTLDIYAEANLPSNRDVIAGVTFGNADTGVYVEALAAQVAEGVTFGPNEEYIGTLPVSGGTPVFPSADDVRLGSPNFGIVDGVQYVPNCRVPGVAQVEAGFRFDSNDSLVGELAGGAYGPANTLVLMIRGDDYSLEFTDAAWKDLGMDAQTAITMGLAGSAGVAEFGGSYDATKNVVTVPLTSSETAQLRAAYQYDIQATVAGAVKTLVRGQVQMYETYTDAPTNGELLPGWLG